METYRVRYLENILDKPVIFYDAEGNSSGSLASRLSGDPRQLQELLGVNTSFPLISFFNVIGCVAVSFAFGWKLTLVAVFSALPIILLAALIRTRFEVQYETMNAKVFAESSQFASEAIAAFRTVTALTIEDTIKGRYQGLLDEHIRKAFRKARYATLIFALSDSVELLCMALTFWYGGQLLASREYDVFHFFVIYAAIIQGGQSAGMFLGIASNVALASTAGNRILSLRSKHKSKAVGSEDREPASEADGGAKIQLKDVSFKYPARDVPVFSHLNLTIEPGQFAALVGPSGCGKTTVVSLLERFYDIHGGSVQIDGTDIRTLPVHAYRTSLGLVSQEPTLFSGTVRDNLLLGLPTPTPLTDEELASACRDAEIHDFIASLPQGYDTPLGASGGGASGGSTALSGTAAAAVRRPAAAAVRGARVTAKAARPAAGRGDEQPRFAVGAPRAGGSGARGGRPQGDGGGGRAPPGDRAAG